MKKTIISQKACQPIGPYSHAVEANGFIFTAGQTGVDSNGKLVSNEIAAQTRQAMDNIKSILAECGLTMDHVVKTTVFLQRMEDFTEMNSVYGEYFSKGMYPARSAVEISYLPKGALVEIETICVKEV